MLEVHGDLRLGGRGLRDRESTPHGLVVQLRAQRGQEQPGGEYRDSHRDRDLHQQHLGEHPPRQTEAQSSCEGSGAHGHDGTGSARPSEGSVVWIS